jgi:DNA-binding MarR family transcriptional regulator
MNKMPNASFSAKTAPVEDVAVRSWLSVVRAYHLCDAVMAQRLGALQVKTPEHEILANLLREPGITQQVLAARCFSAKSHISGLLTTLEDKGWVKREAHAQDARAKSLSLTAAGTRMAKRTVAAQAKVVAAMAGAMSAAELVQVRDAMLRVSDVLQDLLSPGQ